MNTLDKVKQWFIDRDLENGGRLDKQSLKLSEEFGELCAGYLKKNEQLTKDSIGDCAVVIVVSPFVVQYGWNEIITTIVPVGKITVWQALGMDALLSFIWPVLSSKKESEEDYSYEVKSSISKIITCAFLIWLASLFL